VLGTTAAFVGTYPRAACAPKAVKAAGAEVAEVPPLAIETGVEMLPVFPQMFGIRTFPRPGDEMVSETQYPK